MNADNTLKMGYSLDIKKTLEKKLSACNRPHVLIEDKDEHNIKVIFSASAFELARNALNNFLKVEMKKHVDGNGGIVTEKADINNWSDIIMPAEMQWQGACKVVVHIYRTTSSFLFNGADAWAFVRLFMPLLDDFLATHKADLTTGNENFRNCLSKSLSSTYISSSTTKAENVVRVPGTAGIIASNSATSNCRKIKEVTCGGVKDTTTLPSKICKKCKKNIRSNAINCEICRYWTHYHCEKLTQDEVTKYEETGYTCKSCKMLIIPSDSGTVTGEPVSANNPLTNQDNGVDINQTRDESTNILPASVMQTEKRIVSMHTSQATNVQPCHQQEMKINMQM